MSRLDTVRDRTGDVADRLAPLAANAKAAAIAARDSSAVKAALGSTAVKSAQAKASDTYAMASGPASAAVDWAAPRYSDAVAWAAPRYTDAVAWAAPRVSDARDRALPLIEEARERALPLYEKAVDTVREDVVPRVSEVVSDVVGRGVAASGPVRDEAVSRGTAAIAALRGQPVVVAKPKRRVGRTLLVLSLLGGAGYAAYAWWTKQSQPPAPWETTTSSSGTSAETGLPSATGITVGDSPQVTTPPSGGSTSDVPAPGGPILASEPADSADLATDVPDTDVSDTDVSYSDEDVPPLAVSAETDPETGTVDPGTGISDGTLNIDAETDRP